MAFIGAALDGPGGSARRDETETRRLTRASVSPKTPLHCRPPILRPGPAAPALLSHLSGPEWRGPQPVSRPQGVRVAAVCCRRAMAALGWTW
jgi:hypothetical protein